MARSDIIKKIAVSMVRNHIQYLRLEISDLKQIFSKEVLMGLEDTRVITILGAGASYSLGLPLENFVMKKINEDSSLHKNTFDGEINPLTSVYRQPHEAVETNLIASYSNPGIEKEIRSKLQELYNFRYLPILSYEILAHLFKHRFIDAIINFNFDELLDQSIEDELVKEEYDYVLSDGDYPDEGRPIKQKLDFPLYIKPYGTVSHPSTLRFTTKDNFELSLGISNLIKNLSNTDCQLVLIVIGFGMQSAEFNKILENIQKKSMIYFIDINEIVLNDKLKSNFKVAHINIKRTKLKKIMEELWVNIKELFRDGYKIRGICRHRLISKLFEPYNLLNNDKYNEQLPEYFRQRTIIEILLAMSKSKGILNIGELSYSNSGLYYKKYKALREKNDKETFYEICQSLGFTDMGHSNEFLRLHSPIEKFDELILGLNEFKSAMGYLFDKVKNLVPAVSERFTTRFPYSEFVEPLLNHYNSEEVEIKIIPEPLHTKIFRNAENIMSSTEFIYQTYKMLSNKKCKHIWVIAEAGAWLTAPLIKNCLTKNNRKVSISLIVADTLFLSPLRSVYKKKLAETYLLPWWIHNRHMTISLDSKIKPITSIYFVRPQRSSYINHVKLNKDDTEIII